MKAPRTAAALIDAIGRDIFGRALWPRSLYPRQRAGDCALRGAIPVALWAPAIRLAKKHGIALTQEQLYQWHARARAAGWQRKPY